MRACHNVLEKRQRTAINEAILSELAQLGDDKMLVHMSDVDELLDLEAVAFVAPRIFHAGRAGDSAAAKQTPWCVSPLMMGFQYSQHCPTPHPIWARSVLCSPTWLRNELTRDPNMELRKLEKSGRCPASSKPVNRTRVTERWKHIGYHFSYFFDSEAVLRKVSSFQHADDPAIAVLSKARNRTWALGEIERRVKICMDPTGQGHYKNKAVGAGIFPDDKRMPLLTDWPRHPYWLSVDDAHARASAMKLLE